MKIFLLISILSASSAQDLLFLDEDTILEVLPSFAKSACQVNQFPDQDIYISTGIDSNTLVGCGGLGCWSLKNGTWNQAANMIRPRYGAGSSNSPRGLFLTGGLTGGVANTQPPINTSEVLVDGRWEPGPDLPSPLVYHCQVTVGQTIYIIGGTTDAFGSSVSNRFYSLDASNLNNSSQWTQLSPMRTARWFSSCVYNDGLIYVVGGNGGSESQKIGLTTTEIYNLSAKSWSFGPALPQSFVVISAIQYQQEVYVIGQSDLSGTISKLTPTNLEEIRTFDFNISPIFRPAQITQSNICFPVTTSIPPTTVITTTTVPTTTKTTIITTTTTDAAMNSSVSTALPIIQTEDPGATLFQDFTTELDSACKCGIKPNRKQNRVKENKVGRQSFGGGTNFPWFAQLFFPGENQSCSGVIINSRWILTALHCVVQNPRVPITTLEPLSPDMASVLIGPGLLRKKTNNRRRKLLIDDIVLNKYGANLAMVKVTEDIPIKLFPPICLPNIGEKLDTNNQGTIVQTLGEKTRNLMLTNVTQCWPDATTPENWFCFGSRKNIFTAVDSGGPVMVGQNNRWVLAGIIAGGTTEDFRGPGIAVSMYWWRNWVNNVASTGGGEFCDNTDTEQG